MIRTPTIAMMIALTGAGALAVAHADAPRAGFNPANQTVVSKNQDFPVIGPQVYQRCAVEDCSDVTE